MIEQYIKVTKQQQLSREELSTIINLVDKIKPCNMLVFGVGADTKIWQQINSGITVFLEHDQKWIDECSILVPEAEIIKVTYTCKASSWKALLNKDLFLNLPEGIINKKWDIILVDSPVGNINGRMESIYTASKLKYKHCFIHDCEREIESVYCNKYFGLKYSAIRKLRHYGD